MTDPIERLRAMNRPYEGCQPPARNQLARRATRRTVRFSTVTGTAVASVVALAVAMTGAGATQSLREVTAPSTPTPAAAPTPVPGAGPTTSTGRGPGAGPGSAPGTGPAATGPTAGRGDDQPLAPIPDLPTPAVTLPSSIPILSPSPSPTSTWTPPPSGYPTPKYWRGSYGASPYFARQVVTAPPENFCRDAEPQVTDPVLPNGGGFCMRMVVQPSAQHGGDYLAELAICLARDAVQAAGFYPSSEGWEVQYDVYDYDAKQTVAQWRAPASYTPSAFTLQPGDCAFYVWHQQLVKTDGTPFTAGHEHYMNYRHASTTESVSDIFIAP